MKNEIFQIFDQKANVYNKPFYFPNEAICLRAMQDLLNANDNDVSRHPADFILYNCGSIDLSTGKFSISDPATIVCRFNELNSQWAEEV